MEQSLEEIFESLGFSKDELKIYMTLLTLGASPASVVANKSEFKRGHAYNLLTALEEKGLAQVSIKNGVRSYCASPPKTLVSIVNNQQENLMDILQGIENILPFLESIQNSISDFPQVRFFRGKSGIKSVYQDTLQDPKHEIYAIGDYAKIFPEVKNPELNRYIWDYALNRAKKGIHYYGIVNKSSQSDKAYKLRKEHKRTMKMLSNVDLSVEVNVYGNKVALMSSMNDMMGIIIESKSIAETLRNFHQAVWPLLPNYR